jgi:hypothetical protein
VIAAVAGPWSAAMRMGPGTKMDFAYDVSYRLRPGTDGPALLAAVADLSRGAWLTPVVAAASSDLLSAKVASKREGDVLTTVMILNPRTKEARAQLADIPFLNGKPLTASMSVAGDRLLVAVGGESKDRLALLRSGRPGTPTGDAATALAETKGAEGLYFMDAAAAVRPALSVAAARAGDSAGMASAVMGMALSVLGDMHLGTFVSYQGGEAVTFTWRTPMATFQSIAKLYRALGGARADGNSPKPL